jgi:hypothetical protein
LRLSELLLEHLDLLLKRWTAAATAHRWGLFLAKTSRSSEFAENAGITAFSRSVMNSLACRKNAS